MKSSHSSFLWACTSHAAAAATTTTSYFDCSTFNPSYYYRPACAAGIVSTKTACKHSCAGVSHTVTAILKNQELQRRPNVRKIGARELQQVLPWTGSKRQFWRQISDPFGCLVRLGVSLSASVLLYDISTLGAAVAFLYWAWGPMWSAALLNSRLRLRYPYAGVWHAKLLMIQIGSSAGSREILQDDANTLDWSLMQGIFERSPKLYITVGDESQASFQELIIFMNKLDIVEQLQKDLALIRSSM